MLSSLEFEKDRDLNDGVVLSVLVSVIHVVVNASMCSNEGRPISIGIQLVITAQ